MMLASVVHDFVVKFVRKCCRYGHEAAGLPALQNRSRVKPHGLESELRCDAVIFKSEIFVHTL